MQVAIALLIPFLGTVLGAALVFFMKKDINLEFKKLLSGFAAGVMVAASIWSLILPAMDMTEGNYKWVPVTIGFMLGIGFLLLLDVLVPHQHVDSKEPEGLKSNYKKSTKLLFAVTLHNIPEGMTVGVVLAGFLIGNTGMTISGALALAVGIALQNIPEGAIVSMPLKNEGLTKKRSFVYGSLSGIVEPIGSVITILFAQLVVQILPYLLSFAAGAMIYVVADELIPESQEGKHTNIGTIGLAVGFLVMMILDTTLG